MSTDQLTHLAQSIDDLVQGIVTTLESEPSDNGIYRNKHAEHLEEAAVDLVQVQNNILRIRAELAQEGSITSVSS